VSARSKRKQYAPSVGAVDTVTASIALATLTAVVLGALCFWYMHERRSPDATRGMRPPPPPFSIDAGPRPPPHRNTIDVWSVAYRTGYADVYYSAAHPYRGVPGMRPTDPDYNVYLSTPHSEWEHVANHRIRKGTRLTEQECDPFGPWELRHLHPRGDWQDNMAGSEQALQDVAARRAPWTTAPPGYSGDVDCD
jgi:hypothetical protein